MVETWLHLGMGAFMVFVGVLEGFLVKEWLSSLICSYFVLFGIVSILYEKNLKIKENMKVILEKPVTRGVLYLIWASLSFGKDMGVVGIVAGIAFAVFGISLIFVFPVIFPVVQDDLDDTLSVDSLD